MYVWLQGAQGPSLPSRVPSLYLPGAQVDVRSSSGALYLDADLDNSSTADPNNRITIAKNRALVAKTLMTLEVPTEP